MFFEAIKYAAKSSIARAGAWAPLPGALVVWAGLRLMGYQIAAPETWVQGIFAFFLCAGAAWSLIFVGRFLYWPYRELSIARRKLAAIAAVSPVRLRRLIAYGHLDLIVPWDGKALLFRGYNVRVDNVSDDTIRVHIMFLNAYVDEVQLIAIGPSSPRIVPQTQGTTFQTKRHEDAPISMDARTIMIEFEFNYDTVPETGVRRSYRKIAYPLNWASEYNPAQVEFKPLMNGRNRVTISATLDCRSEDVSVLSVVISELEFRKHRAACICGSFCGMCRPRRA